MSAFELRSSSASFVNKPKERQNAKDEAGWGRATSMRNTRLQTCERPGHRSDVVRQSRRQKARKCRVPFLSIVLVRRFSGNTAWRLAEAIIAERSVRTLWQSGSPKRLRLGLILAPRQVAESVRLGVKRPAAYAEVASRQLPKKLSSSSRMVNR